MSVSRAKVWINSLGMTHAEMVSKSVVPDEALLELFPGVDELYIEPAVGVEMNFWAETERYESLHFTLEKTTPSTVEYQGELPDPFGLCIDRSSVRALFGKPLESSGPVMMPEPRGQTGGWDFYALDPLVYPEIKVLFKYIASMKVSAIVFTLIEKTTNKNHPVHA
jgi:hypothetical protein